MDVLTGLLIALVAVLTGFIGLHAYAVWSIRGIDTDRGASSSYSTTIDGRRST
jgi:hypothetical protein